LIDDLPEDKQKELLILIGDQRKYERTAFIMQVVCETKEECFKDFILDICPGGIFLETIENLFVGQKLTIAFKLKHQSEPVKVMGSVA